MPGTETLTSAALSADQPWRGQEPYTEQDRAFFHGRRRELDELRRLLQRDTLTLLTGPTGTGKTSLLRAGLFPSLQADWLPVLVTIDWSAATDQRPLSQQVLDALETTARAQGLDVPRPTSGDTLWEAFHRTGARWWSARQRVIMPLLVLDHFEQAFMAGVANATLRRHRDRFLEELSQLAANRPPQRVASRLEDQTEKDDAFNFGTVPVRILIVIREEMVPRLTARRALFPTLRRSELRLLPFTLDQARDALIRAAAQRGLFAEGVVDQLVPHLSHSGEHVTPANLSQMAHSLAAERLRRNAPQITADFFHTPAPPASAPPSVESAALPEPEPAKKFSPVLVTMLTLFIAAAAALVWRNQHDAARSKNVASTAETTPIIATTPISEAAAEPAVHTSAPNIILSTPAPAPPTPKSVIPAPESIPVPSTPAPLLTPSDSAPTTTIAPAAGGDASMPAPPVTLPVATPIPNEEPLPPKRFDVSPPKPSDDARRRESLNRFDAEKRGRMTPTPIQVAPLKPATNNSRRSEFSPVGR